MHKIITKKYIINIVKENIGKIDEKILKKVLLEKNIPINDGYSKEALIKMLDYHKINLWTIYELLKDSEFGCTYKEVLKILDVEDEILDKLIEKGVINVAYTKKINIKGNEVIENYYSLEDIYDFSKENLIKFREMNLKGEIKKCKCKENKENHIKKAYKKRIDDFKENLSYWNNLVHKDNVIVSVISTGIDVKRDEIIEIAIADIEGKIIYHNTFKTNKRVSDESYAIKRISKESISKKKTFTQCMDEVYKVLENKRILSYNANLVCSLLKGNGYSRELDNICLMESYMKYVHSKYIIRVKRALNMHSIEENSNDSKAIAECLDLLALIKAVCKECEEKMIQVTKKL